MTVNAISPGRVQQAIASAASATGIDFDYLMGQAKVESGLNAAARAGKIGRASCRERVSYHV